MLPGINQEKTTIGNEKLSLVNDRSDNSFDINTYKDNLMYIFEFINLDELLFSVCKILNEKKIKDLSKKTFMILIYLLIYVLYIDEVKLETKHHKVTNILDVLYKSIHDMTISPPGAAAADKIGPYYKLNDDERIRNEKAQKYKDFIKIIRTIINFKLKVGRPGVNIDLLTPKLETISLINLAIQKNSNSLELVPKTTKKDIFIILQDSIKMELLYLRDKYNLLLNVAPPAPIPAASVLGLRFLTFNRIATTFEQTKLLDDFRDIDNKEICKLLKFLKVSQNYELKYTSKVYQLSNQNYDITTNEKNKIKIEDINLILLDQPPTLINDRPLYFYKIKNSYSIGINLQVLPGAI
jgi:hypothetical protein